MLKFYIKYSSFFFFFNIFRQRERIFPIALCWKSENYRSNCRIDPSVCLTGKELTTITRIYTQLIQHFVRLWKRVQVSIDGVPTLETTIQSREEVRGGPLGKTGICWRLALAVLQRFTRCVDTSRRTGNRREQESQNRLSKRSSFPLHSAGPRDRFFPHVSYALLGMRLETETGGKKTRCIYSSGSPHSATSFDRFHSPSLSLFLFPSSFHFDRLHPLLFLLLSSSFLPSFLFASFFFIHAIPPPHCRRLFFSYLFFFPFFLFFNPLFARNIPTPWLRLFPLPFVSFRSAIRFSFLFFFFSSKDVSLCLLRRESAVVVFDNR